MNERSPNSKSDLIEEGEIATTFIQRNNIWDRLFSEPARFKEPKPPELQPLSDDNWAALIMRIDPLARRLLDPLRIISVSIFLLLVLSCVFMTIRPCLSCTVIQEEEDDNYFNFYDYEEEDDLLQRETNYFKQQIASCFHLQSEFSSKSTESMFCRQLYKWIVGYLVVVLVIFGVTGLSLKQLSKKNHQIDETIRAACLEMRSRFASEGFCLEYRLKSSRWFFSERLVVFFRGGTSLSTTTKTQSHNFYSASRMQHSFFIKVPLGHPPDQPIQVTTPSNQNIMVSIPLGVRPGQQFPVLIPPNRLDSPNCNYKLCK